MLYQETYNQGTTFFPAESEFHPSAFQRLYYQYQSIIIQILSFIQITVINRKH